MAQQRKDQHFCLKILSGPHAGAELVLAPGSYDIGRSDQCDIIINDDSVAPYHARLLVGADGTLSLTPLAQPLTVAGKPVSGDMRALRRLDLLTAGSTQLCIGLPEDDWAGVLKPQPGAVVDTGAADEAAATAAAQTPRSSRATRQAAAASLRQVAAQLSQLSQLSQKQFRTKPRRAYSLGAVGLLFCGVLLVVTVANTKSVGEPSASRAPLAKVHRILDELDMQGLDVSADENGIVKIQGFVKQSAQVRMLDRALRPLGNRIRHRVWSDEGVAASIADILRQEFGVRTVRVASASAGRIALAGYFADEQAWSKIVATLAQDVSGVNAIVDDEVQHFADRLNDLRHIMAEENLGDKLQLRTQDHQIHVSGALSQEDLVAWRSVERGFKKRYGGQPIVKTGINQAPDLKLAIRGVSVGVAPFITTQNGNKYMEGSTLADGYIVKSIQPDRLILSKQNRTTVYYLGGE